MALPAFPHRSAERLIWAFTVSTVLIIGARKGIGLETVKRALKAGHSVRALSRSATAIRLQEPIAGNPDQFVLYWEETGGPIVIPPTRTGYGCKIVEGTMRRIGKHQIEYAPSGLKYRMEAPIEKVGWVIENKPAP